jgi:hypothetical protein
LGSTITNEARYIFKIKSRIAMAKSALKMTKTPITGKMNSNLRKKLAKRYIRSSAFYSAETWTLGKVY